MGTMRTCDCAPMVAQSNRADQRPQTGGGKRLSTGKAIDIAAKHANQGRDGDAGTQ